MATSTAGERSSKASYGASIDGAKDISGASGGHSNAVSAANDSGGTMTVSTICRFNSTNSGEVKP